MSSNADDSLKTDATTSQAEVTSAEERVAQLENIPPASFSTLVQILVSQAMVALGMIPGPDGKQHKELAIAKHFVDLMSVLEIKTKGNLDEQEAKMFDTLLHDLRMAYIRAK